MRWDKDTRKIKAVNLVALPIMGVAKGVSIKLGTWSGQVDFVIVQMDDFDMVLGMEFLLKHKDIPISLAKCLVVMGTGPIVVQIIIKQLSGVRMISALQLKKGLTHDEPTFMAFP